MDPSKLARLLVPQKLKNRLRAWQLRLAARPVSRANAAVPCDFLTNCRLCRASAVAHRELGKVPVTHDGAFAQRDYRLILCRSCESVYLDPAPTQHDLAVLYTDSHQFTDPVYSDGSEAVRIVAGYARRLKILGLLPKKGDAIFEVGAGRAWISRAARKHEPGIRTVAQDVSAECVAACPWVDRYIVSPLEALPREPFRLVSMTHVIEHLPDPAGTLAQLNGFVAPGGHIYITAPFRPALWTEKEGLGPWLHYSYLHVPAHISYLSQRWLRKSAANAGFELVHWDDSHDGHQVFEAVLRKNVVVR